MSEENQPIKALLSVGPYSNIEIQADSVEELKAVIEAAGEELVWPIRNFLDALGVAERVVGGLGAVHEVSSEVKPGPECAHGARVYKSGMSAKTGRKWEGLMCSLKQGSPGACAPIFKSRDNADEPYWP